MPVREKGQRSLVVASLSRSHVPNQARPAPQPRLWPTASAKGSLEEGDRGLRSSRRKFAADLHCPDQALTSAAQAATIILDGAKADRWRILVADAHKIDEMVRRSVERLA